MFLLWLRERWTAHEGWKSESGVERYEEEKKENRIDGFWKEALNFDGFMWR